MRHTDHKNGIPIKAARPMPVHVYKSGQQWLTANRDENHSIVKLHILSIADKECKMSSNSYCVCSAEY